MDIRILPGNIANIIAAGEVVERPASVVKELMENSLDAGATQVTVVIKDAGRTLIQVIDNGKGMTPDEAVVCFERHATSKIASAEDLMNLSTFGFRGEALASIAAVAEVTLKTRKENEESGCEVCFAASSHLSTEEVSVPVGSNFAVRNLFYNVPARRKFLKTDNAELKHIVAEFTKIALTRPDVGFNLSHNDKDMFVLRPARSLKFRIQDLFGDSLVSELVDIEANTSVVRLSGYIGRPDMAKKGLGRQFFFVNGRFFKSAYLHKAVMKGYEHLITEGVTPTYFMFLETAPEAVDVNISPTKTEVKFEDDSVISQIVSACIKETLGRNSFGASIDFDREGAPELPVFGNDFEQYHPISEPKISTDPNYNPFDNDGFPSEENYFDNAGRAVTGGAMAAGGDFNFGNPGETPGAFHNSGSFQNPDGFQSLDGYHDQGGFQGHGAFGDMPGDFQDNLSNFLNSSGFGDSQDRFQNLNGYDNSQGYGQDAYYGFGNGQGEFAGGGSFRNGTGEPFPYSNGFGGYQQHVEKRDDYGKLFEDKTLPSKQIIVYQGRYIFTAVKSGILAVNVKRAKERILYDRFYTAMSSNRHVTQTTLFPVTVVVGVENVLLFEEYSDLLVSSGFDIRPFGNDSVVVNGVPEGYSVEPGKVHAIVSDLIVSLSDDSVISNVTMTSAIADRFAKIGASEGDSNLSVIEAQRLIDALFACEKAEFTNSGHKTMSIISSDSIDKLF